MNYTNPKNTENEKQSLPHLPLPARMRPKTLADLIGQEHLLGEGKILRRIIETDTFTSIIFYGPPGAGKTSLAEIISKQTNSRFIKLSGVTSSVPELRKEIEIANKHKAISDKETTILIDEIHRFNKAQQDALLPHLENATIKFIGATTHNPYFYLNAPLVSRSQIFQLEPLTQKNLLTIIDKAITDENKGLAIAFPNISASDFKLLPKAAEHIAKIADGDARKCLSALENSAFFAQKNPKNNKEIIIDLASAEQALQKKSIRYDANEDEHYDTISAFIKSIRGSDPDATLYWLAKMLYAGEDPRFIARRIIIAASEDIGLADSNALRVSVSAQQAVEFVGMPEARIPLAHAAVYLATAPKSNSTYAGLEKAFSDVKNNKTHEVPLHLRTPTRKKLTKNHNAESNAGEYKYAHDYPDNFVPQNYLPKQSQKKFGTYYQPTENGLEKRIKERLEYFAKISQEKYTHRH